MNVIIWRPLFRNGILSSLTLLLVLCISCSSGSSSNGGGSAPITPTAPAAASTIYFAGYATSTVYIYPVTGSGTVSQTATLTLPQQYSAYSVATDSSGQIYVGVNPNGVLVFPAGSTGSATPIRSISVPAAPFNLYVDSSNQLYVDMGGIQTVNVYSNTASGSAPPVRSFTPTNVQTIQDVTTDSSGNVYLAGQDPSGQAHVDIYNAATQGSSTPTRVIDYPYLIDGLATDASGDLFASAAQPYAAGLIEFGPSASGSANPLLVLTLNYSFPNVPFSGGLRRDAAGNLYLALTTGQTNSNDVNLQGFAPNLTTASKPFVNFTVNAPGVRIDNFGLK